MPFITYHTSTKNITKGTAAARVFPFDGHSNAFGENDARPAEGSRAGRQSPLL